MSSINSISPEKLTRLVGTPNCPAIIDVRDNDDFAAALARLYRARLPSPEDIIDPGEHRSRPREDRGHDRDSRAPRGSVIGWCSS